MDIVSNLEEARSRDYRMRWWTLAVISVVNGGAK